MRSCPTLKREVLQYPSITEDRNLQSMTSPPVVPGYRFAFTVNHYTESDIADVMTFASQCKYVIFGKEIAESGTPHLQGFLITKATTRLSKLKKVVPRAHWENAKKCNDANVKYCKKQGDSTEIGQLPQSKGQAQVDVWQAVRRLAQAGDFDAIPDSMYIRYKRTLHEIHEDHRPEVEDLAEPCGIWITGPAGSGKSTYARTKYPKTDLYKKDHTTWWTSYAWQPHVLLEDVGHDDAKLGTHFKLWADKWSFPIERKSKPEVEIRPETFIVTSQYTIDEIWQDHETREALNRRFKTIVMRSETQDFSGEF